MFHLANFYKFCECRDNQAAEESLARTSQLLQDCAQENDLSGLVILADEGVNGTVAGAAQAVSNFKQALETVFGPEGWQFKEGQSERPPFRRGFVLRRREEIVTTRASEPKQVSQPLNALSPEEWQALLESEEDVCLLDVRNYYETDIGSFRGAILPQTRSFKEFAQFLDQAQIPREKKVLMYCTGGIRCEKAILEMKARGYDRVYQLFGGILNYLKEFPDKNFQGECFVFDQRVALTQQLAPSSTYVFCPHCGQAAKEKITCRHCSRPAVVCQHCLDSTSSRETSGRETCSKNCAHHLRRLEEQREKR